MKTVWLGTISALALVACAPQDTSDPAPETTDAAAETSVPTPEVGTLDWAVTNSARTEADMERDAWRNPAETLAFFDIENTETVVEIWPGGGWYTDILAPYLRAGGGTLIAAGFDLNAAPEEQRARLEEIIAAFTDKYTTDPDLYGTVEISAFSDVSGPLAASESVDTVLTFRNVHNWMGSDYTAKFFEDAFAALKPGGVLGVVEHRLPSSEAQSPRAETGYVHEDFVKALAIGAGFEFSASSEINANPADTADHPFGVWTLPPRSATTARDGSVPEGFDPAIYAAIGESDRMTLKFIKPIETAGEEAEADAETGSEPVE